MHGEQWFSEWTISKQPTPKHSHPPLIRDHWRESRPKFLLVEGTGSWRRLSAWLTTTLKSCSGQQQEECRNSQAHPPVTVTRTGAQTTQAGWFFFAEDRKTQVHWWATAEPIFFSKFNKHIHAHALCSFTSHEWQGTYKHFFSRRFFPYFFVCVSRFVWFPLIGPSFILFLCLLTCASSPRAPIINSNFCFTILLKSVFLPF